MDQAEKKYLESEKIYEHLGHVINCVVQESPQDAYGLVEVLSRLVKEKLDDANAPGRTLAEELDGRKEYSEKAHALMKEPKDEETGEPLGAVCSISDFMEEADMFAWAGAGFSEIECYKVKCSMRNLAQKKAKDGVEVKKLRFWGKILGTQKDYYVLECDPKLEPEGGPIEQDQDTTPFRDLIEGGGGDEISGVNTYSYFVTTDLCDGWTMLPDLKPSEIRVARQIKKVMTGNLTEKVVAHPFFDGTEGALLRAQIAQITSDTVLCVKGFLIREEGSEPGDFSAPIVPAGDDFKCPLPSELLKMENWMHMQPHILLTGKTTHKAPDDLTDENAAEVAKQKAEIEADGLDARPGDPARRQKDQLRPLLGDGLQWVVKQAGDTTLYKNPFKPIDPPPEGPQELPPRSYATTYVRSLTWPGAVTAARNGQFANIYVGYGLKAGGPDFFLRAPPDVEDEPEDREEEDEPGDRDFEPEAKDGGD